MFYALCGSPRKKHNTDQLLDFVLNGIMDIIPDAKVKKLYVYDYNYTGCISCYACKRMNGKSYGKCAKKDDISELLYELSKADGIVIGSPVYFHDIPGQLRSFMERLLYPYLVYGKECCSIAPRKMPTAFIYTMNATEEKMKKMNYPIKLSAMEEYTEIVFTKPDILYCYDTYQFDDYSLYKAERFPEREKFLIKQELFPKDCEKAFALGQQLARKAKCQNPIVSEIPDKI